MVELGREAKPPGLGACAPHPCAPAGLRCCSKDSAQNPDTPREPPHSPRAAQASGCPLPNFPPQEGVIVSTALQTRNGPYRPAPCGTELPGGKGTREGRHFPRSPSGVWTPARREQMCDRHLDPHPDSRRPALRRPISPSTDHSGPLTRAASPRMGHSARHTGSRRHRSAPRSRQ